MVSMVMPGEVNSINSRRNVIFFMFDVIILVLFCLLFRYQLISARYHEISGFILIGLLGTHIVLHLAWFKSMKKQLGSLTEDLKFVYYLNLVFLFCIVILALTGLLISRTLGIWGVQALDWSFRNTFHQLFLKVHTVTGWFSLALLAAHLIIVSPWISRQVRETLTRAKRVSR